MKSIWSKGISFLFLFLALALALGTAQAQQLKPAPAVQAELDAIVKLARAEGEVLFYCSATEIVCKRVSDGFIATYGLKSSFVRLGGGQVLQRYAAEASTGNIAADLVFVAGGAEAFSADGVKKGWVDPISEVGIPAMRSGLYPASFGRGSSAIVGLQAWAFSYNSDKVKGSDIPKDWPDLLNPKWKGQIIVVDPRTSDANIDFWTLILDKYGETFFKQLLAQDLRINANLVPAMQAQAAGEAMLAVPTTDAVVQDLKARGAPLGSVIPGYTTGVEQQVFLTARAKARHPNAARLLAHYVMAPEGNKVFNSVVGTISIYDTGALPKEYQSPKPGAVARKDQIFKLFGLQ
jgi:iron(III) transport system substrate-binding protein